MKVALGKIACSGIETHLGADVAAGVRKALFHYARKLKTRAQADSLPPAFSSTGPRRSQRCAFDLTVDPETEAVLEQEALRQRHDDGSAGDPRGARLPGRAGVSRRRPARASERRRAPRRLLGSPLRRRCGEGVCRAGAASTSSTGRTATGSPWLPATAPAPPGRARSRARGAALETGVVPSLIA